MKRLILSSAASLIILSSYREKTESQVAIQAPASSVFAASYTDISAEQRSNQSAEPTDAAIPSTWVGKYSAYFTYGDIAGQNAGWELDIKITNSKITAEGKGFQMAFLDELSAKAIGSKLILTHLKNVSGYRTGKSMIPEFILINDHGKFYVQSKWIDGDVKEKPEQFGYKIDKTTL
ncbi:hypothetical protein GJU39_18850 [Pedobacter petrophilus]|uniref:Uncharacterized protein n=1 Tax=Pedobacter petrophilus TaxID=1908241 RepID=A0A7K0G3C9_9SPHI|nr:hypothetical protein [Pedobacter petrophilus]MRX78142.1 hypothetical protein [Pedobacter petrophilus]